MPGRALPCWVPWAMLCDQLKAKSVVCIGPNIPNVGTWSCDGIALLAKEKGFVAETILMDPGTADSTSTILQAAASKPDVIILGLPKGVTIPLLTAAEEPGLNQTVKFLSAASAYDLSVPGTIGPGWDGNFYVNMEFNDLEATTPDDENWLAVMNEYGQTFPIRAIPSHRPDILPHASRKRLSCRSTPRTSPRESTSAAIRQVKGFTSDLFCAPWYFGDSQPRHNANSTTRMAVSEGGKWKVISDCAPSPDPELADIRALRKEHRARAVDRSITRAGPGGLSRGTCNALLPFGRQFGIRS